MWRLRFLAILFVLAACGPSELPEEMPDDFDFSLESGIEEGGTNEIDTYENTYRKNFNDEDFSTELMLSHEEKEIIYESMKEADILNTPDRISVGGCAFPHMEYYLSMTINGTDITRDWATPGCDEEEQEAEKLLNSFVRTMNQDVIEEREEYQALPEDPGGYH